MDEKRRKVEPNFKNLEQYGNAFDISERKELIGEMLRLLRQSSGLTQNEIAKCIGIKSGTYSTYENGTRETPAEIIVRLSLLYDVPTDVILQQSRLFRDNFEAQKQIDVMNEQLSELKDIISDRENELNPDFAQMMQAMTDAFTKMGEQITVYNDKNKK